MKTRPAAIAASLVAACLAAAPLGVSWLGGCTTTVVDFKLGESPPEGGSSDSGREPLEMDAAPPDASVDADLDASPDGSTGVTTGRCYFVQYKCCLTTTDCVVDKQGDGILCKDLGEWKVLASQACESMGRTLYSLGYDGPC